MIDRDYLITYMIGLAFIIALLCFSFESFNLIQWVITLCIGAAINIMAALHFATSKKDTNLGASK